MRAHRRQSCECQAFVDTDVGLWNVRQEDVFWGIGRSGEGHNELGKALTRLRERLLAMNERVGGPGVP